MDDLSALIERQNKCVLRYESAEETVSSLSMFFQMKHKGF